MALASCSSGGGKKAGVLYGLDGEPKSQVPVQLMTIDDEGAALQSLGLTITDENGRFTFDLSNDTNAITLVAATVDNTVLRGFWAGSDKEIPVHPATEALVQIIVDITSSPEGRTLSDFRADELHPLIGDLMDQDFSSATLTQPATMQTLVRSTLGRAIAVAAGGSISSESSDEFDAGEATSTLDIDADPRVAPGDIDESCSFDIYLFDSADFQFDLLSNGSLCGKTNHQLPAMLVQNSINLDLPADLFFAYGGSSFPFATNTAQTENGRELLFGPFTLQRPVDPMDPMVEEDDTEVSRKVYVPSSGNYVRYLEIFENHGAQDRTLDVSVSSSLLTSNDSALLTVDPEYGLGEESRFIAAYDENQDRPTVGFLFQDGYSEELLSSLFAPGLAGGAVNEVAYRWNQITVPAGEMRTFVHYVWLTDSRDEADVQDSLSSMLQTPDMDGMSQAELAGLLNFLPVRGTIQGEAGSVIGYATVTASIGSTQMIVTAKKDGSFAIPLQVDSGDRVLLLASDGLSTFVTVP